MVTPGSRAAISSSWTRVALWWLTSPGKLTTVVRA